MAYQIIDNFLDKRDAEEIREHMIGGKPTVPWFFNAQTTYNPGAVVSAQEAAEDNEFMFIHIFYTGFAPVSAQGNLVKPIVEKINPSAILRIKANLYTRNEKLITYPYHIDFFNFIGKTAVYFVNSNNGKTIFEGGDEVESVENRLLIFDSTMRHTGTNCTDEKARCVINFCFYEWTR